MRFIARSSFLIFVLLSASVMACSVPVFRYALEHWPADPFQVTVFYRGALPVELEAALNAVEKSGESKANVLVRRVDLDAESASTAEMTRLFEQQPGATLPWMLGRFPSSSGIREPIFSGPFQAESVSLLTDSPVRREVTKRLSEGESAVWLLLESGNKPADDAAEKLLQERLDYLAGVMTLPKLDESDIANGLVSVPEDELRLEFSIRRISRTDPAEQMLVAMLLRSEEGLLEIEDLPMVFPIFGRGRSLYALVGAGIRSETIESAAAFLIGKCSCQVKEQNPGVDLLMTADWEAAAKASPVLDRDLPTLAELMPVAAEPEAVTAKPSASPEIRSTGKQPWLLAATAAVMLALALMAIRKPRRR